MTETGAKSPFPLLLLAALAFVPGLGLFFGSAAVTWGLLSKRPRTKLAIGIGAAGALLQFAVMGLFLFQARSGNPVMSQVWQETTRQDLARVVVALERYHREQSRYPETLAELSSRNPLSRPVNIFDQSRGLSFKFRPYQYRVAADGTSYDLFAVGPDGEPGTADDIRPVLPDSLRRHSGFRPAP